MKYKQGLPRRSSIPDDSNSFSIKLSIRPTCGVENSAPKCRYALDIRKPRDFKYSKGRNQDMSSCRGLLPSWYVFYLDVIQLPSRVPICVDNFATKNNMRKKGVFVAQLLPVFLYFRLEWMWTAPVSFQICGKGIEMDPDIRGAPLVRVFLQKKVDGEKERGRPDRYYPLIVGSELRMLNMGRVFAYSPCPSNTVRFLIDLDSLSAREKSLILAMNKP